MQRAGKSTHFIVLAFNENMILAEDLLPTVSSEERKTTYICADLVIPDEGGRCHGRASLLCGQRRLGCSYRNNQGDRDVKTLKHACAPPWLIVEAGDSLSVCLQLADLKKGHEIVFGVTRTSCGASHRAELRRWHWKEKKRGDMSEETDSRNMSRQ